MTDPARNIFQETLPAFRDYHTARLSVFLQFFRFRHKVYQLDTITAVGTDKFTHFEVFLADYEWPYDRIAFTTGFEAQQSVNNYVYIDNVFISKERLFIDSVEKVKFLLCRVFPK